MKGALRAMVTAGLWVASGLAGSPALVSVTYQAWNEKIEVDAAAGTLVHHRTHYTYDNPVSGNPSGSQTEKVAEGKLSRRRISSLARLVKSSGFMDLDDASGAPEGERFYPYRLEAVFKGGRKKSVEHRSNPSYGEEPPAFKKIVARLRDLSAAAR